MHFRVSIPHTIDTSMCQCAKDQSQRDNDQEAMHVYIVVYGVPVLERHRNETKTNENASSPYGDEVPNEHQPPQRESHMLGPAALPRVLRPGT